MIIKNQLKRLGLGLGSLFLLAACSNTPVQEDSSVVLEKALNNPSKVFEAETKMEVSFANGKDEQKGTFVLNAKEKSNMENPEKLQSDSSLDLKLDLTMLQPVYNSQAGESKEELQQIKVDAAGEVQVIEKDLYFSLKKLDLGGKFQGLEEAKAILPVTVGPYMNNTLYLSMDLLESLSKAAQGDIAEAAPDYKDVQLYAQGQMLKDLADSKALVVSKDYGMEKVETPSGKKVETYHYQITFDPKGLETFLKKANEKFKMLPQEEMDGLFKKAEDEASFEEVIQAFNQAMSVEIWLGQKDYHAYKFLVKSDINSVKVAAETLAKVDTYFILGEEMKTFFKKGTLNINLSSLSEPISAFTLKKPDQKDVIDLGPLLNMALMGVEQQMQMPSATEGSGEMTEEELNEMMKGMEITEEQRKDLEEGLKGINFDESEEVKDAPEKEVKAN